MKKITTAQHRDDTFITNNDIAVVQVSINGFVQSKTMSFK